MLNMHLRVMLPRTISACNRCDQRRAFGTYVKKRIRNAKQGNKDYYKGTGARKGAHLIKWKILGRHHKAVAYHEARSRGFQADSICCLVYTRY